MDLEEGEIFNRDKKHKNRYRKHEKEQIEMNTVSEMDTTLEGISRLGKAEDQSSNLNL